MNTEPILVNEMKVGKELKNLHSSSSKRKSDEGSSSAPDWDHLLAAITTLNDTTSKLKETVCLMAEGLTVTVEKIVNLTEVIKSHRTELLYPKQENEVLKMNIDNIDQHSQENHLILSDPALKLYSISSDNDLCVTAKEAFQSERVGVNLDLGNLKDIKIFDQTP